jgi:divalent metal cation (Fe/Co/Zn/Cd) transporter
MARKCKIISCGQINKKIISLIIGGIFYAMTLFFEDSSKIFSPTNPHPIVYTLIYSIGLCLSFIFYVVYRIKNRRKKNINSLITDQNSKFLLLIIYHLR